MKCLEGLAKDVNSLWITRKKHELWQLLRDREKVKGGSGEQPQMQKYLCSALPSQWHINFKLIASPGFVYYTQKSRDWEGNYFSKRQLSSLHTQIHAPKKIKKATNITLWLICSEMSL